MWKRALVSSTGAIVALRLYHSSSHAKSDELELKHVVCIARHGARTALGLTRNDQTPLGFVEYNGNELFKVPHGIGNTHINLITNNEQLKSQDFSPDAKHGAGLDKSGGPVRLLPGNVKGGQLTRVGFEQAFELGQYLRNKYNIANLNEVNCRSTAFQRTIETMQGIVTGIQPNQAVDIAVPDNIDEIVIFQRELLEKYPQIGAVRKRLHDAVGTDPINLELARMASQLNGMTTFASNVENDANDGSVPSIPESVFGLCATRDEFLSRKANHVTIAAPFDNAENDLMRLCALLYRRMFLIWCGRSEAERRIVMPLAMGRLLEFVANYKSNS